MSDIIPLKYKFCKFDFLTTPSQNQNFTAYYTTYDNFKYETPRWTSLGVISTDVYGNIVGEGLILSNLNDDTEYIIKFVDIKNKEYLFKFKTCISIGLNDSPYYNKVLMPGQIYDWYVTGLDTLGLPTSAETEVYYKLESKKTVTAPEGAIDNYGSLCVYEKGDSGFFTPTIKDLKFDKIEDKDGFSFFGARSGIQEDGSIKVLGDSSMKYDGTKWVYWKAYLVNAGGGGIAAKDVSWLLGSHQMGFAFCIDEDITQDVCICGWDRATNNSTKRYVNSYKIYFTTDNKLKTIIKSPGGTNEVTDTNVLSRNKWYYILPSLGGSHTLYIPNKKIIELGQEFQKINIKGTNYKDECDAASLTDMEIDGNTGLVKSISYAVPFLFGDDTSKGVTIAQLTIQPKFEKLDPDTNRSILLQKIFNKELYAPKLKLNGTTDIGDWEYVLPNKQTTTILSDKLSFLVPTDIFDNVALLHGLKYSDVSTLKLSMIVNGETTNTQTFKGFDYKDVVTNKNVHVGSIIDPSTYIADSFRIKFAEENNPKETLACYFFTKHGSWGGYNGGVNGHNIYFNADGNLILECHGDNYKGSLKGVSKEGKVRPYTGYGTDISYSSNSFDHRTNADTARTGTALVSNKYFQYGRMDVTMKIPVGCYGVCPALWYFHYIEVGDTDYRYKEEPYCLRNEQGSSDDGFYRVVNNEIDIELPSHLTNGVLPSWNDLSTAYFDKDILDNTLRIGVKNGSAADKGLWRLKDPSNPNIKSSWVKVSDSYKPRYLPSFQNCKFNNWLGELNAGNGWCLPTDGFTAEDYYKGTTEESAHYKEEYLSKLTHGTDELNGFADGNFHKWTIIWVQDRTVLMIDDKLVTQNKGFVPFNHMKYTIAMWFPTMPSVSNEDGVYGVKDSDGINTGAGGILTSISDTQNYIGTWAGNKADFEVCHLEISEIQYIRYKKGDTINIGEEQVTVGDPPSALGESFPESGLRIFDTN